MRSYRHKNAFSLTEVLLAVGTLAIGLIFIGGTFLAGIHFSTIATERTITAIVADEAFAKIKLYGVEPDDLATNQQTLFVDIDPNEFAYPSTGTNLVEKQYFWSALCRREAPDPNRLVQVTVFISRKVGSGTTYQGWAVYWPVPVQVSVSGTVGDYVLTIQETDKINWINDGYTIVENGTGQIYRVVERGADPAHPEQITLSPANPWLGGNSSVWVVPPPVGSGRKPCIAIYQKGIRF